MDLSSAKQDQLAKPGHSVEGSPYGERQFRIAAKGEQIFAGAGHQVIAESESIVVAQSGATVMALSGSRVFCLCGAEVQEQPGAVVTYADRSKYALTYQDILNSRFKTLGSKVSLKSSFDPELLRALGRQGSSSLAELSSARRVN